MNYLDTAPRLRVTPSFAGGVAGFGDIASASFDSMSYADNANSAYVALERAYGDRIEAIRRETGVTLANPLVEADSERRRLATERPANPMRPADPSREPSAIYERKQAEFVETLSRLEQQHPDKAATIRAGVPMIEDAKALARGADARLQALMGASSGVGKWAAVFAGGGAAMFRDPVQIGSMALGGGPGAARTIAGRIMTVTAKQALISGATEAVIQPSVQAWRREAGLSAGFDEGVRNVLFATAIGGVAGGGFQAAGEAVARYAGRLPIDDVAGEASRSAGLPTRTRELLEGRGVAVRADLAPIRADLPAEARGALDAADRLQLADDSRPPAASLAAHDRALTAAESAIARGDYGFYVEPDADQVSRIADQLLGADGPGAPTTTLATSAGDPTIVDFLIKAGGVRDFRGELAAIGGDRVSRRFRGRLMRDDGVPLDRAREMAAEAGFLNDRFGTAERAVQDATVADLLDAIDAASRAPDASAGRSLDDGERAYVERLVADIARHAGPAVDDALILRAARLANDDGLEPFDALERVLIEADGEEGAVQPAAGQRTGDPLPGWSDAELDAASANRPASSEPGGLDDPRQLDADDELTDAELAQYDDGFAVPFGDGELVDIATIREQLARGQQMQAVVEACRV